jgi:hypothetical protein
MRTTLLLVLPLLLAVTGCRSAAADVPCTCGDPLTDLEGCAHPDCIAGRTNPNNPQCVCGVLEIPHK